MSYDECVLIWRFKDPKHAGHGSDYARHMRSAPMPEGWQQAWGNVVTIDGVRHPMALDNDNLNPEFDRFPML